MQMLAVNETSRQPSGDQMMVSFNNAKPDTDASPSDPFHSTKQLQPAVGQTSDDDDERHHASLNRTTPAAAAPPPESSATTTKTNTTKFRVDTAAECHPSPASSDIDPTHGAGNSSTTTVVVKYVSPTAATAAEVATTASAVRFTPRALDAPLKFRTHPAAATAEATTPTTAALDAIAQLRTTTNHCVDGAATTAAAASARSVSSCGDQQQHQVPHATANQQQPHAHPSPKNRVSIAFAKADLDACSHCYGTQIVSDAMLNVTGVVRRFSRELHAAAFAADGGPAQHQPSNPHSTNNNSSATFAPDDVLTLLQAAPHDQLAALTAAILQHAATVHHAIENRLADPCTCGTVGMEEHVPGSPATTTAYAHTNNAHSAFDAVGHRGENADGLQAAFKTTPAATPRGDNTPRASPTQRTPTGTTPHPLPTAAQPSVAAATATTLIRSPQLLVGIPMPPPPPSSQRSGLPSTRPPHAGQLPRGGTTPSGGISPAASGQREGRTFSLLPQTFVATGGAAGLRRATRQRSAVVFQDDVVDGSGALPSPQHQLRPPNILQARKSLIVCTSVARDLDDVSGFEMVNQYLMMEEIGSGASGIVFAVCNTESNKDFAMKVIKRDRFQQRRSSLAGTIQNGAPQMATNREVAIMKKLRHPNIVRLHEVIDDHTHNKLYLVMQLLTGGRLCPSLDMATGACEPVPADLLRRYVYQMCDGLRYLHQHNIIHRDVKPENMMLDEEGNVVLVDFGVSEVAADDACTVEGAIGTPAFMAPEVWDGDKVCGAAADVWSLGVSVFMMLVGRSPFPATTRTELIEQVRTRRPDFPPDMAPEWRSLLIGTLTKDPATRTSLSAIMRNPMFAEFRPLDASTSQRPSALRGAIVVTDDDVHDAIATREDIEVEITVGTIGDNSTACELESGERHTSLLTTEHQQEPDTATAATGNAVTAKSIAVAPISSVGGPLGSTRVSVAVEDEASRESSTMRSVDALPLSGGGGACGTGGSFELDATVPFHHQRTSMLLLDEAKFHRALARRHSSAPPAAFMESS